MASTRALALGLFISVVASAMAQADPFGPSPAANAYINLGAGSFASANSLATGNPQAWYTSTQIGGLFGGTPTAAQQQSFDQSVMQDVQTTFRLSGISIALTDNPAVSAAHSMSLVAGASSTFFPGAVGTTDMGQNGFSFIDPIAPFAHSVDQLEWIVAHNISHELMLAFGVNENYDQTGNYVDAKNANLSMMINPNATFSAPAAQAIEARLGPRGIQQVYEPWAQGIAPTATATVTPAGTETAMTMAMATPTPEPATLALWGLMTAAAVVTERARRRAR